MSLCIFEKIKKLVDDAINKLSDDGEFWKPKPESNSITIILKHLS
ncbi:MAG TPA: hypothetical protein DIU05_00940 [Bacteroidetes bacterium]|nr:hypothetical protein [Bacteroidota bacterium]